MPGGLKWDNFQMDKAYVEPGVMAHSFNPSTWSQRLENHCEFRAAYVRDESFSSPHPRRKTWLYPSWNLKQLGFCEAQERNENVPDR